VARAISRRDFEFAFLAAAEPPTMPACMPSICGGFAMRYRRAGAPSMFRVYQSPPRLQRALVVAISQSGQSPDIIAVVQEGRRQGAVTLAVTNDSGSPLALSPSSSSTPTREPRSRWRPPRPIRLNSQRLPCSPPGWKIAPRGSRSCNACRSWSARRWRLDNQIESVVARYRDMKQCVVLGGLQLRHRPRVVAQTQGA